MSWKYVELDTDKKKILSLEEATTKLVQSGEAASVTIARQLLASALFEQTAITLPGEKSGEGLLIPPAKLDEARGRKTVILVVYIEVEVPFAVEDDCIYLHIEPSGIQVVDERRQPIVGARYLSQSVNDALKEDDNE